MNKVYSRIFWQNYPNLSTPINENNLNSIDVAVDEVDNRVINLNTTKADKSQLNDLVNSWLIDEETGIITITKVSGEKIVFDLNIEKIPVAFTLSEDGILTMTTDDGTVFTANIGAMIPVLTFENSDTIAVNVTNDGINKTYSFTIKNGSITEAMLQSNFLGEVKTEVAKAEKHASNANDYAENSSYNAQLSQSYAIGGTELRENENTDNSKYYAEQAKAYADEAAAVASVNIATVDKVGIVKPDGTTITIDEDGTIHGASITVDSELSETSDNPVQNKIITAKLNGKVNTDSILILENIILTQSSWTSNNLSDYPYRYVINFNGVTADYVPLVNFSQSDSLNNIFAPFAESGEGAVTVFASEIPEGDVTVQNILCIKGGVVA